MSDPKLVMTERMRAEMAERLEALARDRWFVDRVAGRHSHSWHDVSRVLLDVAREVRKPPF